MKLCSWLLWFVLISSKIAALANAMSIHPLGADKAQLKPSPPMNMMDQKTLVHIPSFAGIGVTNILSPPASIPGEETTNESLSAVLFYVGTKRGKLKKVTFSTSSFRPENVHGEAQDHVNARGGEEMRVHVEDIQDANGKILKPYPIFSMIGMRARNGSSTCTHILTGGGDRYITVWEPSHETISAEDDVENKNSISITTTTSSEPNGWIVKTQLGPHTGWVKDLASFTTYSHTASDSRNNVDIDNNDTMVFSIGCNCIEVWKYTTATNEYQHFKKLQIESSAEMGCTLSSDLLCLETYSYSPSNGLHEDGNYNHDDARRYLFAGGVDGRLHQWELILNKNSEDTHGQKEIQRKSFVGNVVATAAHDGRVNGIMVCKSLNVLISIGSDGIVQCRDMLSGDSLDAWSLATLDLNLTITCLNEDEISSEIKITSLCSVMQDSNKAVIAIGTSCGQVLLVTITRPFTNGVVKVELVNGSRINLDRSYSIHTLRSFPAVDNFGGVSTNKIVIGHSAGLALYRVSIKMK